MTPLTWAAPVSVRVHKCIDAKHFYTSLCSHLAFVLTPVWLMLLGTWKTRSASTATSLRMAGESPLPSCREYSCTADPGQQMQSVRSRQTWQEGPGRERDQNRTAQRSGQGRDLHLMEHFLQHCICLLLALLHHTEYPRRELCRALYVNACAACWSCAAGAMDREAVVQKLWFGKKRSPFSNIYTDETHRPIRLNVIVERIRL